MTSRYRPPEKPIGDRSSLLVAWLGVACALGGVAMAAGPVSEDQAVEWSLARPAVGELTDAELAIARGNTLEAGRVPNPTLAWSRESTTGGLAASAEDYATLMQPLDFSGRRRLRREAGERREAGVADDAHARRIELVAEVRTRFYDTLHAERRVAALADWSSQMERVAGIIAQREAAGDVSGFDRRRAEREQMQADARVEGARGALEHARERLAAVIGRELSASDPVSGSLLPAVEPPPLDELLAALPSRPDVRALDASLAAAELEHRAAGRWWAPEVTITGGLKTVEVQGVRSNGYLAGVFFPFPVLDRHQAEAARADGQIRRARAERTLLLSAAAGDVRGLRAEAVRLIAAARRARSGGAEMSARLIDTAEAGYGAGELEIVGLLDAHRSALEAELQALDLELDARRATIALERETGGGG
jgi:cobalt-zinc-cadmium efflux system outer membrane protein